MEINVKVDNSGDGHSAPMKKTSIRAHEGIHKNHPPTSYFETLMHFFKANVGTGCFALASAMMNGGIIVGPLLLIGIGLICVHVQHILVNCANHVKTLNNLDFRPDYAETLELSFLSSKNEKCRRWGPRMKTFCNIFICVAQLGFCSVYFLFVGRNLQQVLNYYDFNISIHWIVSIVLVPIWLSSLIRKLKYIGKHFFISRYP